VFESPSNKCLAFDIWYHLSSSSLNNWLKRMCNHCFKSASYTDNKPASVFLSNMSSLSSNSFFSFLFVPLTFFAHPLICYLNLLIFDCHCFILSSSSATLSHISFTISPKSSCSSKPNSNLNRCWLPSDVKRPISRSKGV
jgi:hypothetical protein